MMNRGIESLRLGMEAAVIASVPQVLLPKLEERLFLPHHEDADLGPRVIERAAELAGKRLPEDMKWLGASAFHFGYAMAWGAAYAIAYEKKPVEPWLGGVALSALIWGMTFPAWGIAVLSGSEDHPRRRTWRKEVILATAPIVFGMGTALIYGRGPGRTFLERVRKTWRTTRS